MTISYLYTQLEEDCSLEVLKYLSIKERIKYELVNKQFKQQLDRVWRQKQVLSFTKLKYEYLFCGQNNHRVFACNTITFVDDKPVSGLS